MSFLFTVSTIFFLLDPYSYELENWGTSINYFSSAFMTIFHLLNRLIPFTDLICLSMTHWGWNIRLDLSVKYFWIQKFCFSSDGLLLCIILSWHLGIQLVNNSSEICLSLWNTIVIIIILMILEFEGLIICLSTIEKPYIILLNQFRIWELLSLFWFACVSTLKTASQLFISNPFVIFLAVDLIVNINVFNDSTYSQLYSLFLRQGQFWLTFCYPTITKKSLCLIREHVSQNAFLPQIFRYNFLWTVFRITWSPQLQKKSYTVINVSKKHKFQYTKSGLSSWFCSRKMVGWTKFFKQQILRGYFIIIQSNVNNNNNNSNNNINSLFVSDLSFYAETWLYQNILIFHRTDEP